MAADAQDAPTEHPVRPALSVLQQDQRALFREDDTGRYESEYHLKSGFPDREAVIRWYQRAIVRTFGHLTDRLPASVLETDPLLLSCLIVDETERRRYLGDGDALPLWKAERVRDKFWATTLRPACRDAYRELADLAGEYIGGDDEGLDYQELDPDNQKHIAMRPGFQQLDTEQSEALDRLFDGFADRDDIQVWLHGLDQPTNGAIRGDIGELVENAGPDVQYLLEGTDEPVKAQYIRELFAINLLPAFAKGVKDMSSGELAWSAGYRDQPGEFD